MTDSQYNVYTDGGSINNEFSACAYIITDSENTILHSNSIYMANNTNNWCEYHGIIFALISTYAGGIKGDVTVYSDSQLVINQINGLYQVKALHLMPLHKTVTHLKDKFTNIKFIWIPREHNIISQCDKLCDETIMMYKKE